MESLIRNKNQDTNSVDKESRMFFLSLLCCIAPLCNSQALHDESELADAEKKIRKTVGHVSQSQGDYYNKKLYMTKQRMLKFQSGSTFYLSVKRLKWLCADLIRKIDRAILSVDNDEKISILGECEREIMKKSIPEIRYNKYYRELHGNDSINNSRFVTMSQVLYPKKVRNIESDTKAAIVSKRRSQTF